MSLGIMGDLIECLPETSQTITTLYRIQGFKGPTLCREMLGLCDKFFDTHCMSYTNKKIQCTSKCILCTLNVCTSKCMHHALCTQNVCTSKCMHHAQNVCTSRYMHIMHRVHETYAPCAQNVYTSMHKCMHKIYAHYVHHAPCTRNVCTSRYIHRYMHTFTCIQVHI